MHECRVHNVLAMKFYEKGDQIFPGSVFYLNCLNSSITVKSRSVKDVFWIVWVNTWPGCSKHNIYTIAPKQPYIRGNYFTVREFWK